MVAWTVVLNPCQKIYMVDIEKNVKIFFWKKLEKCSPLNICCTSAYTCMFLDINMLINI